MDYKEKVIALLNSQELSKEQKEKLEELFPQLKESEDERIKKAIIDIINNGYSEYAKEFTHQDLTTWLEKQSEPIDKEKVLIGARKDVALSIMDFIDRNTLGMCLSNMECEDLEDAVVNSNWSKVYDYMKKKLEKQGEQKSSNKVEPKFKIGAWVVFNNKHQSIYQVEKIEDGYYILRHTHGGTFRVCVLHDESLRLWTIQDAKDGDVLVHSSFMFDDFIFIYNNTSILQAYCYYSNERNRFIIDDRGHHCPWNMQEVTPATREQRDTLEKAMADARYTFDFGKKDLKKIEQKLANKVEPKFKVGDKIIEKDFDECGCGTIIDIKEGKYIFDNGGFIYIEEQGLWELVG